MKFREISKHEFRGVYQFFENLKPGFGIVDCSTETDNNYAETKFGFNDKCLLKTEHVNGVNNPPIFYEATRTQPLTPVH